MYNELSSSLKIEPFADLLALCIARAFVRWLKEEWWKYFCRFVSICFTVLYNSNIMNKFKSNDEKKKINH